MSRGIILSDLMISKEANLWAAFPRIYLIKHELFIPEANLNRLYMWTKTAMRKRYFIYWPSLEEVESISYVCITLIQLYNKKIHIICMCMHVSHIACKASQHLTCMLHEIIKKSLVYEWNNTKYAYNIHYTCTMFYIGLWLLIAFSLMFAFKWYKILCKD